MNLTLKEIRPETSEANSFVFEPSEPVTYLPGQHIILRLPIEHPDNRGTIRNFTLSSSPTEKLLMITTKRGPSTFKQALFSLPIGSTIEAKGPAGSFILHETDSRQQVMLAGGIGITPFRSMVRYCADKSLFLPITILYSNKTPSEIVFRKELEEIVQRNSSLKVVETITRSEGSSETWSGQTGRIDEKRIKENVKDLSSAVFYVAGPTSMVESMRELLKGLGVTAQNIFVEEFPGY